MANHLQVDYPDELLKTHWDKAKGLLAKRQPTGIGEVLAELKKLHDDVKWQSNMMFSHGAIVAQDKALVDWPDKYKSAIGPLLKKAAEVKTVADKGAAALEKDKLVPKSAVKAAQAVAKAATAYRAELEEFEGTMAKAMSDKLGEFRANARKMLKPSILKGIQKSNGLVGDIVSYAKSANKKTFFEIFSGDSNARGYCTVLKSMDQLLAEFPEIRDQVFTKGSKLTDTLLPGMGPYGANWAENEFEKKFVTPLKLSEDDAYKHHAKKMIGEVPKIKQFVVSLNRLTDLL